jgi:hypothetical protein
MQNVWQKRGLKTVNTNYVFDELLIFTEVFVGDKAVLSRTGLASSETQPQCLFFYRGDTFK